MIDSTLTEEEQEKLLKPLVKRLKRNCTGLNAVLKAARRTWPDACLYLDGTGNLNLMKGDPHEGDSPHSHPDRILGHAHLNADGGDW
jgi:hypothetical protein